LLRELVKSNWQEQERTLGDDRRRRVVLLELIGSVLEHGGEGRVVRDLQPATAAERSALIRSHCDTKVARASPGLWRRLHAVGQLRVTCQHDLELDLGASARHVDDEDKTSAPLFCV